MTCNIFFVPLQDPLFVDMIGTCHTELCKPAVLQPKHLTRYRQHVARGFSVFPPEVCRRFQIPVWILFTETWSNYLLPQPIQELKSECVIHSENELFLLSCLPDSKAEVSFFFSFSFFLGGEEGEKSVNLHDSSQGDPIWPWREGG